jgi:hypothetical protein
VGSVSEVGGREGVSRGGYSGEYRIEESIQLERSRRSGCSEESTLD